MKTLLVKAHSFIDVITNSSSELFVTKNPSSIELLSGVDSRYIVISTFKQFKEKNYGYDEDLNDEYFQKKYPDFKDEDLVAAITVDSEDYDLIYNLMKALKCISEND